MGDGVDKLMAYRTMRAVQGYAEGGRVQAPEEPPRQPSLWQRWQAAVYRLSDRLLG